MHAVRPALCVVIGLLALAAAYLLLWPVPVEPQYWRAPTDAGLTGPFLPNDILRRAVAFDLDGHSGPEDVAAGPDGQIYVSTSTGVILRLAADGSGMHEFARVGGRPLGIEFDRAGKLLIANAYLGIQRVSADGQVDTLLDTVDGRRLAYPNDLAVAADGRIFFTDASSRFGARESGGSYPASLLDILEHGGHGRVFEFDPATGKVDQIDGGLDFANGIAISDDQQFLLIAETGHYRIWRHWIAGARAGQREIVLDNLPGFPDNINTGQAGRFWVGLVAPRNKLLDDLSTAPWLRKLVQRLPARARPRAVPSSHVIAIDGDGRVLLNLQDTSATIPALTGACETADALWLSSLFSRSLGRLDGQALED